MMKCQGNAAYRGDSDQYPSYLGCNHYGTRPAKPNEANEKAEFSLRADVHSRNSTAGRPLRSNLPRLMQLWQEAHSLM